MYVHEPELQFWPFMNYALCYALIICQLLLGAWCLKILHEYFSVRNKWNNYTLSGLLLVHPSCHSDPMALPSFSFSLELCFLPHHLTAQNFPGIAGRWAFQKHSCVGSFLSSKSSRAPPNLEPTSQFTGPAIPAQPFLPHSSPQNPTWATLDHSQESPRMPGGTCTALWSWHLHFLESPLLLVTILSNLTSTAFFPLASSSSLTPNANAIVSWHFLGIFISYLLHDILKWHKLILRGYGGQKSNTGLLRLKSRCWQGWVPFRGSGGKSASLFITTLNDASLSCLWPLPSSSSSPSSQQCSIFKFLWFW